MSLNHLPSIVTNGLVFAYDMGNTQKSFRGRPTTNNASNGKVDYYSRWSVASSHPKLPFTKNTDVYVLTNGNNYLGSSGDFNLTNGNTYTISYWYYINTIETMQHNMIPLTSGYAPAASVTTSTFIDTNNTFNVSGNINGWVWGYKTFTVTSAPTYMRGTYTNNSDNTPTGNMYITNVIIESGSIPSGPYGYTGSTRTNTQAIIDQTGLSTVTANSLTYASDGTFSFNGSNSLSFSSIDFSNAQTIEIWLKPTENDSTRRNPYDQAYGGYGTWTHEPSGVFNYYYGDAGVNGSPYIGHTSSFTVAQDEIACVCTTRDTTTSYWYKNGVQDTSYSHSFGTLATTTGNITIGSGYAGGYIGNIYAIKLYNRALSAAEVKQNFNALRGRFGI